MQPTLHSNNIGFLRLLFASLVIVSHAAEIIDGNRSREILSGTLGARTFAELAVDGFFLLSGYLITQSYDRSSSPVSFLRKRVSRIYPGYLVAVFICLALAPLTGAAIGYYGLGDLLRLTLEIVTLHGPSQPGFIGLPYEVLNGSLWTISYEFRCYIFALLVGLAGLSRNRFAFAAISAVLLLMTMVPLNIHIPNRIAFFTGYYSESVRLFANFAVGACFYLFRQEIPFTKSLAIASAAALAVMMFLERFEIASFAVFGGYLIFWFSFAVKSETISRINGDDDVSYGVYLYGWPISGALLYFLGVNSPAMMIALSLPLAYIAGYVSWVLVERPFLRRSPKTIKA